MSKRHIGTSMDDERLLELHEIDATAASTYAVRVTPLLERLDLSVGDSIDWSVDERNQGDDVPMLVFGRLAMDSGDVAAERADAAYPRELRAIDGAGDGDEESTGNEERNDDGDVSAPVPDPLLEAAPPDGLGLDLDTLERKSSGTDGDVDGTLLFESVATDETIGLLPVRFDDGTPYRPEPLPEVNGSSDPVAEAELASDETTADPAPRPETLDAPIDADVLEDVLGESDVSLEALAPPLEELHRRRLVGEADTVAEYPPLAVDDRGICVVDPTLWEERIADELEVDVDRDVIDAARAVHNRQATMLVDDAPPERAREYRDFHASYDAVVTDERETAEWEVADPDTSR